MLTTDSSPSGNLVEKLHKAGELSTGYMLKSLRQGEIELFELSFAKLSGLSIKLIRHVLYADNKELLAVACKLIKLDRIVFSTIYELVTSRDKPLNSSRSHTKPEIMHFYDELTPSVAATLIRTAEFLNGTKQYSQLNRFH